MTIDEAIAKYKEITNTDANCPAHCNISCDKCVQESEQLAEWLEELKALKENSISKETFDKMKSKAYKKGHRQGYNKAIDDFADSLAKYLGVENATKYGNKNAEQQRNSYDTLMKYEIADSIEDVAEQLKEVK